ncbi:hypothetical protein A2U01_0107857, partial [Trifolium medium]|nr:hypothetical protein [Trifolium medium]
SGQSLGDVDLRSDQNIGAVCGDETAHARGSTPFSPLASTEGLLFWIHQNSHTSLGNRG